jgi:hypothetical protein
VIFELASCRICIKHRSGALRWTKEGKKNNPTPRHAWRALARVKSRGHLRGDAIASRASFGAAEKAAGGVAEMDEDDDRVLRELRETTPV